METLEKVRLPERELNRVGLGGSQRCDNLAGIFHALKEAPLSEEAVINSDIKQRPSGAKRRFSRGFMAPCMVVVALTSTLCGEHGNYRG